MPNATKRQPKAVKDFRNTTELLYLVFAELYRADEVVVPSLERIEYAKRMLAQWEQAALKLGGR